jgi:hypothetical protein
VPPLGRSGFALTASSTRQYAGTVSEKFIVVDHHRAEYFQPTTLGESGKLAGVIGGQLTTLAVGLLAVRMASIPSIADAMGTVHEAEARLPNLPLFAAWCGHELELVGQYDKRYADVTTGYRDVSYGVIALLCYGSADALEHFVRLFGAGGIDAVHVGNVAFQERCELLRAALERHYGPDWTKLYKRAGTGA